MSKKSAASRAGWIMRQDGASFSRLYATQRAAQLSLYTSEARDDAPVFVADIENAAVDVPDVSRVAKRFALEVRLPPSPGASSTSLVLAADSREEQEAWLTSLSTGAVPDAWPGGLDLHKRPQPLLYSIWIARHSARAAMGSGGGSVAVGPSSSAIPSPFPRLPALKSAPTWMRKALLLQKLRLCSIVFEGVDSAKFLEDRETKRNTLLEVIDFAEGSGKPLFTELRVLEDAFTAIKLNLFRSLPVAPPPSGNPDDEEDSAFTDPQWPHFSIVYELLLRLVTMDHIDLSLKKKVIDATFVRQLMALFDSEDPRERDYLKTITHRIYSKLTQRRALVRRVICNVFFEFVYETEAHNGIAEMLEILASIINGFAVPIKDEHRTMLIKALIPLHKAKMVMGYHPQLSYCMALYVAKDHVLTRDVIPGLVKLWPFGNSQKQILFLNELEDLFEYVQEDDMDVLREPLALRIAKCIGGLHFQVAERTLILWNSDRFAQLMLEHAVHRSVVLPILFPALYSNSEGHWHETIRQLSANVLDQYRHVDADLFARCQEQFETTLAAQEALLAAGASPRTAPPTPSTAGAAALASPAVAAAYRASGAASPGVSAAASPLHAHKAPAVRAVMSFTDVSHADMLPGQKEHVAKKFVPSFMMEGSSGDAADGKDD